MNDHHVGINPPFTQSISLFLMSWEILKTKNVSYLFYEFACWSQYFIQKSKWRRILGLSPFFSRGMDLKHSHQNRNQPVIEFFFHSYSLLKSYVINCLHFLLSKPQLLNFELSVSLRNYTQGAPKGWFNHFSLNYIFFLSFLVINPEVFQ